MITYIHSDSSEVGTRDLASSIISKIQGGMKVLWLICGGSNLPITLDVMSILRQELSVEELSRLTLMQTDERYGPVGHQDSNWQQLKDLGFDLNGIHFFPILRNLRLIETVRQYGIELKEQMGKADYVIGQFGLGADGHIAGILPHLPAVNDVEWTTGYEGDPFTRISMSFSSIEKISEAYAFVFGSSKKEAIDNLKNRELSLDDEPAQILKKIEKVHFYSDQV